MSVLFSSVFVMLLLSAIVDSVNATMKTPYTGNVRRRNLKAKGVKEVAGPVTGGEETGPTIGGDGGGKDSVLGAFACAGEQKFTALEKEYVCEFFPLDVDFLLVYMDNLTYSLTEGKELYLFARCDGELDSVAEVISAMFEEIVLIVEKMIPYAQLVQNNPDDYEANRKALELFVEGGDLWLTIIDLINPLLSAANKVEVSPPGTGRTKCD